MNKLIKKNLDRILDNGKEIQVITKDNSISVFSTDIDPKDIASTLDVPEDDEDIDISNDEFYSYEDLSEKFENSINMECDRDIADQRIESLNDTEKMYLKKNNNLYIYIIKKE